MARKAAEKPEQGIVLSTNIEVWEIGKLQPYERNARFHSDDQIEELAGLIKQFGFTVPILVHRKKSSIIAGHGRLLAAKRLGMDRVPVIAIDHLSDDQIRALRLADNKIAERSQWDLAALSAELRSIEARIDVDQLGFSNEDLIKLLGPGPASDQEKKAKDPDEADEPPAGPPTSRLGDLWVLGKHRLLVGDSLADDTIATLMNGLKADMVFTDPPYNVDYEGYTKEKMSIKNDAMTPAEFKAFLSATFRQYRALVKPAASMWVCHPWMGQREFQNAIERGGFLARTQIIWVKNTFAWRMGRFKYQHEPIFYCHVAGETDKWYGDRSATTVWNVAKPAANRLHPTAKPIELIVMALNYGSKPDDLVVDLFGGSGSTLIACERTGRVARICELDPKYADGICRRFHEVTGREPLLTATGEVFSKVAAGRSAAAK